MPTQSRPLFDPPIVRRALGDAFRKLDPRHMVRNPVMFVVLVGSAYTTVALVRDVATGRPGTGFLLQLTVWLWFTVLFANFAEAMAEGRGKAQADTLRKSRTQTQARRLVNTTPNGPPTAPTFDRTRVELVGAEALRRGDLVALEPGDVAQAVEDRRTDELEEAGRRRHGQPQVREGGREGPGDARRRVHDRAVEVHEDGRVGLGHGVADRSRRASTVAGPDCDPAGRPRGPTQNRRAGPPSTPRIAS